MNTEIAWKLRRILAGYRQQDIAIRIGVSCTRYSALERGEARPRDWEIKAIEKLLPPLPEDLRGHENSTEGQGNP